MPYDAFTYLYPPRPTEVVGRNMFGFYEKRGWIAQAKRNGTCNVIAVSPEKTLKCMSRHGTEHSTWLPTDVSSAAFKALPGDGWYVFVAELLHAKVAGGPRDTNFLFDILVDDGMFLYGATISERQERLQGLFLHGGESETPAHYILNPKTWLAKSVDRNFNRFFEMLDDGIDEGVVLKNPNARLEFCSRPSSNSHGQVKNRRSTKNFVF